jgi:transcriptional regulator with XRE-family HTH domain
MQLFEWIRDTRKKQGMTLQDLAHKINLDHSQLSRIESNRSELNFFTMVRLMYGLNLSLKDFFEKGFAYGLPCPEFVQNHDEVLDFPCFNFNDFDLIDMSGALHRATASSIIVKLIEKFVSQYAPDLSAEKTVLVSSNVYSLLGQDGDHSLINQYMPGMDFSYPAGLDPKILRSVYLSGGVFVSSDLGMLVKQLRTSREISLRELGQMTGITHTVIENFEKIITQRNKLRDILLLDHAFELNGDLIAYAWRTAELYNGIYRSSTIKEKALHPWRQPGIHFIEKMVVISRFFQHHFPGNHEWLNWYRRVGVTIS